MILLVSSPSLLQPAEHRWPIEHPQPTATTLEVHLEAVLYHSGTSSMQQTAAPNPTISGRPCTHAAMAQPSPPGLR